MAESAGTTTDSITTVKLGSKELYSYRDGKEVYVLYSELLQAFQLGNSISPSTLQRRKNQVAKCDQYCNGTALLHFKEAGIVRKEAKKVAVLTISQAFQLLKVHKISLQADSSIPEQTASEEVPVHVEMERDPPPSEAGQSSIPEQTASEEVPVHVEMERDPPPSEAGQSSIPEQTASEEVPVHVEMERDPPPSEAGQSSIPEQTASEEVPVHVEMERDPPPSEAGQSSIPEQTASEEVPVHVEMERDPPPSEAGQSSIPEQTASEEASDTDVPATKRTKLQIDLPTNPAVSAEMRGLRAFWTREVNHKRGCQAISELTFHKTKERLQCKLSL